MKAFYRIFIVLYPKVVWLISSRNPKAGLWLSGRKNIFEKIEFAFRNNLEKLVWMHCSSLGEFEQGRPVLEAVRKEFPHTKILLTFFSPSGYEIRKEYKGADWVFYLPMDSAVAARKFFAIVNPSLVLFVKYEFWYFYLTEAKKRNIPLLLVSGIFRKDQPFFKWYGNIYREMLRCFTHLFVQNEISASLLQKNSDIKNVSVSGDTRFDRVIAIAENFEPLPLIEAFIGNSNVIVAGSTWTEDDEELDHFANTHPDIKFIIAPHTIEAERLKECLLLYKSSILYSDWCREPGKGIYNTLIIDNMGMLSMLYHYATVCYVGGAFGDDGVHNVLEAAVYGKPVVFGPEYDKYPEAADLLDAGGAYTIENALELEEVLKELLLEEKEYRQMAENAGAYVRNKAGATKNIMQYIQENRLLTS